MTGTTGKMARRLFGTTALTGYAVLIAAGTFFGQSALADPASALPQGGVVTGGSATIKQSGNTRLDITTTTKRTTIDFTSFSIGSGNRVVISQPSADSITLNQVTGSDPSRIFGELSSNGRVVLANPNGIYFGPNSYVNVAGVVATTATASKESERDFANGKALVLDRAGRANAAVVNEGRVSVADHGLAAFVAPGVRNKGVIEARMGQVRLASGTTTTVDFYGDGLVNLAVTGQTTAAAVGPDGAKLGAAVDNSGRIIADGGRVMITADVAKGVVDRVINMSGVVEARGIQVAGGEIILDGGDGVVAVGGTLDASAANGAGGRIAVTGGAVTVAAGATIDASGATGGGQVALGGEAHGGGTLRHADATTVASGATIKADATRDGSGGTVAVWSDGDTRFDGRISVRGAGRGNGGFVETSGKRHLAVGGAALVDARATGGKAGTWLLDPLNLTIATGGTGSLVQGGNTADTSSSLVVDPTAINNAQANVSLFAQNSLTVNDAIHMVNPGVGLSLTGLNQVTIGASIATMGDLEISSSLITLNPGQSLTATGPQGRIGLTLLNGGQFIEFGGASIKSDTSFTLTGSTNPSSGAQSSAQISGALAANAIVAAGTSFAVNQGGSVHAGSGGLSITLNPGQNFSVDAGTSLAALGDVSVTAPGGSGHLTVDGAVSSGGAIQFLAGQAGSISLGSSAAIATGATGQLALRTDHLSIATPASGFKIGSAFVADGTGAGMITVTATPSATPSGSLMVSGADLSKLAQNAPLTIGTGSDHVTFADTLLVPDGLTVNGASISLQPGTVISGFSMGSGAAQPSLTFNIFGAGQFVEASGATIVTSGTVNINDFAIQPTSGQPQPGGQLLIAGDISAQSRIDFEAGVGGTLSFAPSTNLSVGLTGGFLVLTADQINANGVSLVSAPGVIINAATRNGTLVVGQAPTGVSASLVVSSALLASLARTGGLFIGDPGNTIIVNTAVTNPNQVQFSGHTIDFTSGALVSSGVILATTPLDGTILAEAGSSLIANSQIYLNGGTLSLSGALTSSSSLVIMGRSASLGTTASVSVTGATSFVVDRLDLATPPSAVSLGQFVSVDAFSAGTGIVLGSTAPSGNLVITGNTLAVLSANSSVHIGDLTRTLTVAETVTVPGSLVLNGSSVSLSGLANLSVGTSGTVFGSLQINAGAGGIAADRGAVLKSTDMVQLSAVGALDFFDGSLTAGGNAQFIGNKGGRIVLGADAHLKAQSATFAADQITVKASAANIAVNFVQLTSGSDSSIGLGSGASGTLQIDQTLLDRFTNTFQTAIGDGLQDIDVAGTVSVPSFTVISGRNITVEGTARVASAPGMTASSFWSQGNLVFVVGEQTRTDRPSAAAPILAPGTITLLSGAQIKSGSNLTFALVNNGNFLENAGASATAMGFLQVFQSGPSGNNNQTTIAGALSGASVFLAGSVIDITGTGRVNGFTVDVEIQPGGQFTLESGGQITAMFAPPGTSLGPIWAAPVGPSLGQMGGLITINNSGSLDAPPPPNAGIILNGLVQADSAIMINGGTNGVMIGDGAAIGLDQARLSIRTDRLTDLAANGAVRALVLQLDSATPDGSIGVGHARGTLSLSDDLLSRLGAVGSLQIGDGTEQLIDLAGPIAAPTNTLFKGRSILIESDTILTNQGTAPGSLGFVATGGAILAQAGSVINGSGAVSFFAQDEGNPYAIDLEGVVQAQGPVSLETTGGNGISLGAMATFKLAPNQALSLRADQIAVSSASGSILADFALITAESPGVGIGIGVEAPGRLQINQPLLDAFGQVLFLNLGDASQPVTISGPVTATHGFSVSGSSITLLSGTSLVSTAAGGSFSFEAGVGGFIEEAGVSLVSSGDFSVRSNGGPSGQPFGTISLNGQNQVAGGVFLETAPGGSISLGTSASLMIAGPSGLSLRSDQLTVSTNPSAIAAGSVRISTATVGASIGVGDASGFLTLSPQILAAFAGIPRIAIGDVNATVLVGNGLTGKQAITLAGVSVVLQPGVSLVTTGANGLIEIDLGTNGSFSLAAGQSLVTSGDFIVTAAGPGASLDLEGTVSVARSIQLFNQATPNVTAPSAGPFGGLITLGTDLVAGTGLIAIGGDLLLKGDTRRITAAQGITLGNVDGAADLTVSAGPTRSVIFTGDVGGKQAVRSLLVQGGRAVLKSVTALGAIESDAVTVLTATYRAGSFTVGGDAVLAGKVLVDTSAKNGDVLFDGETNGIGTLTIKAGTGSASFTETVGGEVIIGGLDVTAGHITVGTVQSFGALKFTGQTSLNGSYQGSSFVVNGDVTVAGDSLVDTSGFDGLVSFHGAIKGEAELDIMAGAGAVTLNSPTVNLGILSVQGGTIALGPSIVTSGGQSYMGTVTLGGTYQASSFSVMGDTRLIAGTVIDTAAANGAVSFDGKIDSVETPAKLTIGAGTGAVSLGGPVGATGALESLVITGGALNLATGITTKGEQNFTGSAVTLGGTYTASAFSVTGPATLAQDVVVDTSAANGKITLGASDGAANLTLNAGTGQVSVTGDLGAKKALKSLLIHAGRDTLKSVTATGMIESDALTVLTGTYRASSFTIDGDAVLAGQILVDTSAKNGDVSFGGEVNGIGRLTVKAGSGTVEFGETIGGEVAIGGLSVSAGHTTVGTVQSFGDIVFSGQTAINGSYQGTSFQVNGDLTVAGDALILTDGFNGPVGVTGRITGIGELDILSGTGAVTLSGPSITLGALVIDGGLIKLASAVATLGEQTYTGMVTLGGTYRAGSFTINGSGMLRADTSITTTDGDLTINAPIAGTNALTLASGARDIFVNGTLGTRDNRLASLTIAGARNFIVGLGTSLFEHAFNAQNITGMASFGNNSLESDGSVQIIASAVDGRIVASGMTNLSVTSFSGTISGSGTVNVTATGGISGTISGDSVALRGMSFDGSVSANRSANLAVTGSVNGSVSASVATINAGSVNANVTAGQSASISATDSINGSVSAGSVILSANSVGVTLNAGTAQISANSVDLSGSVGGASGAGLANAIDFGGKLPSGNVGGTGAGGIGVELNTLAGNAEQTLSGGDTQLVAMADGTPTQQKRKKKADDEAGDDGVYDAANLFVDGLLTNKGKK